MEVAAGGKRASGGAASRLGDVARPSRFDAPRPRRDRTGDRDRAIADRPTVRSREEGSGIQTPTGNLLHRQDSSPARQLTSTFSTSSAPSRRPRSHPDGSCAGAVRATDGHPTRPDPPLPHPLHPPHRQGMCPQRQGGKGHERERRSRTARAAPPRVRIQQTDCAAILTPGSVGAPAPGPRRAARRRTEPAPGTPATPRRGRPSPRFPPPARADAAPGSVCLRRTLAAEASHRAAAQANANENESQSESASVDSR